MLIVQNLFSYLPAGFVAAPGVHLGAAFEIDISAYEQDETNSASVTTRDKTHGAAVALNSPLQPTLTLESEFPDQDEYEVRIYNERHGRTLVAAIELISPSKKDRPES